MGPTFTSPEEVKRKSAGAGDKGKESARGGGGVTVKRKERERGFPFTAVKSKNLPHILLPFPRKSVSVQSVYGAKFVR